MSQIDLSIIIPVYNGALLLNRCLDSIFNQSTKYSYEVILVDDGSTDNSVELIKARKEPNIVLCQQQNAGPAMARNKGVELSKGRYCSYLDADDYWINGYIEKSVDFLDLHPECVAVNVAQLHKIYGKGEIINPTFITNLKDRTPFVINDFYSFWVKNNHVGTCSTSIRRNILLESKGQRKDLRICEDMEFWPYIASYGKWGFIPEILYVSDGGTIVNQQGWAKYIKRFQNVPDFNVWFVRLKTRLTNEQIEILKPRLNDVVCGISRAMISGGDFKKSFINLKNFYKGGFIPYMVWIHKCGILPWYIFAYLWRFYQYIKINKGVILHKLHIQ